MPKAFLSGLGVMGRRHLKGLVRAGFDVVAHDPRPDAFAAARDDLTAAGLSTAGLDAVGRPHGHFALAVFAETAPDRLANFRRFLSEASAERILLEKPLSADPAEVGQFESVAREHHVLERTEVNLVRRAWPHVQTLMELCAAEERFAITVNGGAVGMGNIGLHLLDTFLLLSGDDVPEVVWSRVAADPIPSGRGTRFADHGAEFVLRGARGTLLGCLEPASSASVVMVVRGAHFLAQIDYTDMRWKLSRRRSDSSLPNYRYGAEYVVVDDGTTPLPALDGLTERWARGELAMSPLPRACVVHQLLAAVLDAGGVRPPYAFT